MKPTESIRWRSRAHSWRSLVGRSRCVAPVAIATLLVAGASLLTPASASAEGAATRRRVEWSSTWPRFRPVEYVGTALVGATSLYVRRNRDPPDRAGWLGDNTFDHAIRDWLRADTREERHRAVRISDWVSLVSSAAPFAIDLPVVLLAHRQPDVMWQLLMMDIEANAVSGLISNVLFYKVGRGRPSFPDCSRDPGYDPLCGGSGNNASLPSGHTQTVATAAGLTCVHHRYLPLYGNPAADAGACVVMSLATLLTAVTRIIADRHYASDTLIGAAIGFGTGYGLPWLLHYRPRSTAGESPAARRVALIPFGGAGQLGLGIIGSL